MYGVGRHCWRRRWGTSKARSKKSGKAKKSAAAQSRPRRPQPPPPKFHRSDSAVSDGDISDGDNNRRGHNPAAASSNLKKRSPGGRPPRNLKKRSHPIRSLKQENGGPSTVTISIASKSRHEVRELRLELIKELEQVRACVRKLQACELQLAASAAAYPSAKKPSRRPLARGAVENKKRAPKASPFHRNSELLLGKEKLPPALPSKKSKAKVDQTLEPDSQYADAFRNCAVLMSKLMKHRHGWVFSSPVDAEGLGLHDYFTIIKSPMDLGTVKTRLDRNWYKSPARFAEDVRLAFANAMTYNPKGHEVHSMAEQLSRIFEEAASSSTPPPRPPPPSVTRKTALEKSESFVGRPSKKKKAKDAHKRDMTYEEKQRLRDDLQGLPLEMLESIVQIIRKRNSALNQQDDDEIEVDIDSMDAETLWELHRFISNYQSSVSRKKRKVESETFPGEEAQQDLHGRVCL
ncbi:unnamed protein product [Spirodela intermedia]|uniref:Uncharacterized protein n=1 Tax=Spirodela intermedia TaxID=51605 RepID=A0A7I8ITX1_SPIIN|nr:unnamed protein product [Spirodela intermedia]CAA6661069.1 unnamed protein product [Spirodela intermedia]